MYITETEKIRRTLEGNRWMGLTLQAGEALCVLLLTAAAWVGGRLIAALAGRYALPYRMIWIALICLGDLLILSPLKWQKYRFFSRCVTREAGTPKSYANALKLRITLWGKRTGCLILTGLLPAWLCALSCEGATALLRDVTVALFLAAGLVLTEIHMLRFAPAWQLLDRCQTVKETLKKSRRIMRGRLGSYLWNCYLSRGWGLWGLLILPALYTAPLIGVSRALWIQKQWEKYE